VTRTVLPSDAGTPKGTVYTGRVVRHRPSWKRIALISGSVATVLVLLGAIALTVYAESLERGIKRDNAFAGLDDRPRKTVAGALNILVIGSDNVDDRLSRKNQGLVGERSDALILAHIPASHDKAYLISIPRDAHVFVPKAPDGQGGFKTKINSAFAWGGTPLLVETVEGFTGVKIDHVVKIGFAGFEDMTDALGGVEVYVEQTTTDPYTKRTFRQGVNHLDGKAALDYVRQRSGLPNGDFDRVKRQQIFIKALLAKATSTGTLSNPRKLDRFLRAATKAVTVDDDLSVRDVVWQFRGLRTEDLVFITTPNKGAQIVGGTSVVPSTKRRQRRCSRRSPTTRSTSGSRSTSLTRSTRVAESAWRFP